MHSILSLTRLFLISGFIFCVSLPAWAQSSEYGLLLLECTNLDGKKVELTIDVSEPTTNVMGDVVSVSEENGVINLIHENEGTILTLMPRIGKVSHGGKTMDCIFRDAQGTIVSGTIKQEEPEISEPEISEPEISSLSQGDSPIFDVFYVWDIRFSDFYGKDHLTPDEKYSISFERETKDDETIKEEREEGYFKYEITVRMTPQSKERDKKWETFVAIMRKNSDDVEYLVFACSSKPDKVKSRNEGCKEDDVVFKTENPFLPNDRVMITLAINKQAW